jgi:hypothetical protein
VGLTLCNTSSPQRKNKRHRADMDKSVGALRHLSTLSLTCQLAATADVDRSVSDL